MTELPGKAANQPVAVSPLWVVGIGASAGGLPAISTFLTHLPEAPGAAFVIVQHESPDFPSLLPELIQQQTRMPVQVIREATPLAADHIYIPLPGQRLMLHGQQLCPEAIPEPGSGRVIDHFFVSLAEVVGKRAIGILVSGTGHDGTEGLQAVSRAGGIALVQSPESAEFTSMITSALPSGLVDEILSPRELSAAVCGITQFDPTSHGQPSAELSLIDPLQLQRILTILQEQEQVDFSQYKPGTLSRRLKHRLVLTHSANLEDYIQLLETSLEEQRLLRQDFLIGATQFFRDPAAWEVIANWVLPQLLERLPSSQPLRIWIPACATGEEAYTMAILVNESIVRSGQTRSVKIFATDLDPQALRVAAKGLYPEIIANHISPERLERYFCPQSGQFQVKSVLREMLVFASHDLTRNTGFSGMHLVSCRNVLIYMQPELQQQVLRLLHFALQPQGILFLGSSETLGEISHEFWSFDPAWKLYRKRRDVVLLSSSIARQPLVTSLPTGSQLKSNQRQLDRWMNSAFEFCLSERQVTCLLVNRDNQLLHVFYNAANVLMFPLGEARLDVTEVVLPSLRLPLSTALHRARREQQTVLYSGIKLERNQSPETVTLRVGAGSSPSGEQDCLIVLLEVEITPVPLTEPQPYELDSLAAQQISELEYQLQQTRENLQVTIEELETTNEEQQAINEELLAANEELQSVNEELYTVNAEYQNKIQELTQLTGDIDNLLRSTEIGVVFLDARLNLRKFTPAAAQVINLRPQDEGRPLDHFTHNLDCSDFIALLQQAIASGKILERDVTNTLSGDQLLMRVHPYLRDDGTQDGGVVTFVKINELKQTQAELRTANILFENLFRSSPIGLGLLDQNWRFLRVNQTLAEIDGYGIDDHLSRTFPELLPEIARQLLPCLHQVLETGEPLHNLEIQGRTPARPDQDRHWIVSYFPVELPNRQRGIGAVVADVTELKHTQQALIESGNFVERVAQSSPAIITISDFPSQKVTYVNQAFTRLLGYSLAELEVMGDNYRLSLLHPEDLPDVQRFILEEVSKATDGQVLPTEYRLRHRDGHYLWVESRKIVFSRTPTGEPKEFLAVSADISDRKASQLALESLNRELEQRVDRRTAELRQTNEALREEIAERRRVEAQLQTSVAEKELLLKEIHHRVKNNLAIISSVLMLQANEISDATVLNHFREAEERIMAIALVHEFLYQSPNLDQVNFSEYINRLVSEVFNAFPTEHLRLHLTLTPVGINLETAVPCGLLLNELVTNALKHAFPDHQPGDLWVELAQAGEQLILRVRDNGIGFSPAVNPLQTASLGLQLVRDLCQQIKGQLELNPASPTPEEANLGPATARNRGTCWQLTFRELPSRP